MKFIKRFKLFKVLIKSLGIIILFSSLLILEQNYFNRRLNKITNNYLNGVLKEVLENYPLVDEEELIKNLLETNSKEEILEKYGLGYNDTAALKEQQLLSKTHNKIIIFIVIILSLSLLIIYFKDGYDKHKEIKKIIKTLEEVNKGNYELELKENEEGDLSILKDEIYKTTLMLREKCEDSLKGKQELKNSLANISHQIKTPLTSISIMIDNILEESTTEDMRQEFLKDIRYQLENMNFLIITLLKLSRFEANVVEFKKETINVKDMFLDILKNVSSFLDAKNIKVHLNGDSKTTFVADRNWEIEALTNILKNAIQYTDQDKNIYISYKSTAFFMKITIVDEGKGMKPSDLKQIFNRFYKGVNSDESSFGIGLSLAKEIIEKDNGIIKVKSKENKGTEFIIKYFYK